MSYSDDLHCLLDTKLIGFVILCIKGSGCGKKER